jgi:hypothetical protein
MVYRVKSRLYGEEFMVDGLRFRVYNTQELRGP